jgi:hypothetical protein
MSLNAIKLKIDAPTGLSFSGRGFYQLEEDALYVQVGEFSHRRRFFSYLESEHVRFDIDVNGRLMFIEVDRPRRHWKIDPRLAAPRIAEAADVHWLDFRTNMLEPLLLTNKLQTAVLLQFASSSSWRWYRLGGSALIQVHPDSCLAAIFVADLVDDLAGQQLAAFRKKTRRDLRKIDQADVRRISLSS